MDHYVLQVPLIGQRLGPDGRPFAGTASTGATLLRGSMACWHAAACMVSSYYRGVPRSSLPPAWPQEQLLDVQAVAMLAQREGLQPVQTPLDGLTAGNVLALLRTYGPLWAAGRYMEDQPGARHAVVITGVSGDAVLYNDPAEPRCKRRGWPWIWGNLLPLPVALLAGDTSRP